MAGQALRLDVVRPQHTDAASQCGRRIAADDLTGPWLYLPCPSLSQGDAERSLERLHEAAEKDLGAHVTKARNQADGGFDADAFQTFRKNLIGEDRAVAAVGPQAAAGAVEGCCAKGDSNDGFRARDVAW